MGLLTISKWELRRTRLSFGKKTFILSAMLIILIGAVSFLVSQDGLHLNDNIYKVVITDPNLAPVLKTDGRFEVYIAREPEAKELFQNWGYDILIEGTKIYHHSSGRSISALDALDRTIQRYDEARLLSYNDLNNTFPVWITVKNIPREQVFAPLSIQKLPEFTDEEKTAPSTSPEMPVESTEETSPLPSIREVIGTKKNLIKEQALATPSHFNPPVPFKVSPVKPYEIVLGKLLPYLLMTMAVMAAITVYIGGNEGIVLILLPVSLLFLSTAFIGAMIARSFKELTFILVFLSVILSGYVFFPAMFANIHAISIISPMTLVVRLLENDIVSASEYIFCSERENTDPCHNHPVDDRIFLIPACDRACILL